MAELGKGYLYILALRPKIGWSVYSRQKKSMQYPNSGWRTISSSLLLGCFNLLLGFYPIPFWDNSSNIFFKSHKAYACYSHEKP